MVGKAQGPEPTRDYLSPLADGLLAAFFGNDMIMIRKAHDLATWIRENREAFEDAIDATLDLYADRDRRLEPQELRAAVSGLGFSGPEGRPDERMTVIFVLLLERMATLTPERQRATRIASTDQATPAGKSLDEAAKEALGG